MKEKINNFIIGFYLNKHHSLISNNEYYKIKLRVYSCIEKKTKMYVLHNAILTLKDWIQINNNKLISKSNLEKKSIINIYKNLAVNICLRDEVKYLNDFDTIWKNPNKLPLNVYDFLKTKQQEVLINNGISYSNDFKYLIYHLKDFSYKIDIDRNLLVVKGSVPGKPGSLLNIKPAKTVGVSSQKGGK